MKNFKLLFSIAAATVMFGCSSMEVEEQEAYSENLPADFSYAEYMAVHPVLRVQQIKDYVADYNATLKDADAKAADITAFETDTAQLHKIYLDPYMGGMTEAEWAVDMGAGTKDSLTYTIEKRYLNVTVADSTAEPAAVSKLTVGTWNTAEKKYEPVGAVTLDADGAITKVSGNNEAGTLVEFEIAGKVSVLSTYTKVRMDTTKVDTTKVTTAGGVMPADKLKKLKDFNVWDTKDDYNTVVALSPLDTFAISYQYVSYGRMHYWAYRRCTESEKAKPAVIAPDPADKAWVGATKLYCDDNGQIKEID